MKTAGWSIAPCQVKAVKPRGRWHVTHLQSALTQCVVWNAAMVLAPHGLSQGITRTPTHLVHGPRCLNITP